MKKLLALLLALLMCIAILPSAIAEDGADTSEPDPQEISDQQTDDLPETPDEVLPENPEDALPEEPEEELPEKPEEELSEESEDALPEAIGETDPAEQTDDAFLSEEINDRAYASCGDNHSWVFKDGRLTISGTGPMYNYSREEDQPWYSFKSGITTLVIGNGVTTIGTDAFYKCSNLKTNNVFPGAQHSPTGQQLFPLIPFLDRYPPPWYHIDVSDRSP